MQVVFSKNTEFRGEVLTRSYSFDIPELNKEQAFLFKKLIDKKVLSYDKDLIKELYSNYVYRVSETSTGYLELDKDQLIETKENICEFKAEQIWNLFYMILQKTFLLKKLNKNKLIL
jgi:hypothetical protein